MSTPSSSSKKGVLALIAAGIIWGTSFLYIDSTVDQLNLVYVGAGYAISLFYRLFFAFISSLIVFVVINIKTMKSKLFYFKRKSVYLLTLLNVGGYFFQFLGASLTESANLALLVNANIILVPVVSYFWLNESLNYRKIGGIVIGVIGLFFVTTGGFFVTLLEGELIGNLISIGAGICWALYILLSRKVLRPKDSEYAPLNMSLITTVLSFAFLIPLLFVYFTPLTSSLLLPSFPWWEFIYLGIVCTTIAYSFYYLGVKTVSATKTTFILLLETIVGVFLGIYVGLEVFTIFTAIGAGFVLVSIIIISLS